ncbi:type VI secretion system tube protein TssD [Hymenobacter chitinivorans]|uniref:Type VI secretion system needle protein Hcp n=1 Tax=Hymenobacter chitinivorans DSM 11115 TaxID=1121954 RepID=A0A2M9BN43_9BACT|nr:type VI secretion system tube protein TssD [Hymenobacter chitinivorans]PJJ59369.1 hypothetical protein CLV45_0786 [Hymenobacter chitinivorans DSM 11115]
MSFHAELNLEGRTYVVRRFGWSIGQSTDAVGRPEARVHGGRLQVELDSQPDDLIHHWALDDTKKMNGSISIFHSDVRAVRKTITFEDTFCVGLRKEFSAAKSSQNMTMSLSLSANRLTIGSVEIDNKWPA